MKKISALIAIVAIALIAFSLVRETPKRFEVVLTGVDDEGAALDDLIGIIAHSHAYGDRDNALDIPAAFERMTAGDLQQQCGSISTSARDLLMAAGYQARRVALLTGGETNDCDDGHTALEVWHPSYAAWLYLDFSTDRLYMQTVAEFVQARGVYRRLSDAPLAPGYVSPCDDDLFVRNVEAWYDRMSGIPLIQDADDIFYADADHPLAAVAAAYGYALADRWQERFYK